MYGYGTGGGDVGVGEGENWRPKTLICEGGDMEDGILREERGGKRRWRREGQESREERRGRKGRERRTEREGRGEMNVTSCVVEGEGKS